MMGSVGKREEPAFFSDEELRAAAQAVRSAMLLSLEEDAAEEHVFSARFLERMRSLLRRDKLRFTTRRILRSAAVLLLLAILAGAMLLAFNPEARADFVHWIRETYEKSSVYSFFPNGTAKESETSPDMPEFEFTWLPGEFETVKSSSIGNHSCVLLRAKDSDDYVMLECFLTDRPGGITIYADAQTREDAAVNGVSADYYPGETSEHTSVLFWQDEEAFLAFVLSATLDRDDMIRVAEGLVIKK